MTYNSDLDPARKQKKEAERSGCAPVATREEGRLVMCVELTHLVPVTRNVVCALHGAVCYMLCQADSPQNTPF